MTPTPEWAASHEIRDGFLIGYIKERTEGIQGDDNVKDIFVDRFWKDVERHYDKMRVKLLEYCKAEIHLPADYESRVKSPGSIKTSIERREMARIGDGKEPYSNLEDIRADVHDLVGIRIIVDYTPHLDDVNNWIKKTFNPDKDPIPFHADRAVGQQWTPWFGAYYCCNHHISIKSGTAEYLEPYTKVMVEIQVTCLSESLYNKLAHPLLYKGTQEGISRKDGMVIDMAHAMSLCFSICLLYFQDVEDPNLISTMKKTVSAPESVQEGDLMKQLSQNKTFKPNIPLSFLNDGATSETIKRQDVVSLIDGFRHEPTSPDTIWTRMKSIVEEAIKEVKAPQLSLPEVPSARFDNKEVREAPRCHEHTRANIIQKIETWLNRPQLEEKVMWISAPAGTGKSTLARTIAERCESRDMLAATYFFRRGAEDSYRNKTARLLTTIANQLIVNIPRFRVSLQDSLRKLHVKAEDADQKGLDIQLDLLIQNPLSALSNNRGKPKIVLIDAIDECDEATNITQLIHQFSTLEGPAASWLRFLFTSREANYIRTTFQSILHQPILLHEESKAEAEEDIRVYLTYNFAKIKSEKHIGGEWPHDNDISLVVRRATTPTPLFIYASTLLRFIHNDKGSINTVKQFKSWIKQCNNNQSHLGGLYAPILKGALFNNADDEDETTDLQKVLASIACSYEPLSATSMSSLLCIDPCSIKHWLTNLQPVLQVPTDDEQPVNILHESFRDFLLAKDESEDHKMTLGFYESHLTLAEECLKLLCPGKTPCPPFSLFRNIPKPQDFGALKPETIDGPEEYLDYHIYYACFNWPYHLERSKMFDDDTCKKMEALVREATFPWIETMTMIDKVSRAERGISILQETIMGSRTQPRNHLTDLLTKASLFLRNQSDILFRAGLQTCLSASIFCPSKYKIKQSFCHIEVPFIRNITGDPNDWVPHLSNVIYMRRNMSSRPTYTTLCALSLTNTALIRDGFGDIRLYDLERNIVTGHYKIEDEVVSLAFHRDYTKFYSVSSEGRVDLWNIESGNGKHQCTLEGSPSLGRTVISTSESFVIAASSSDFEYCHDTLFVWNLEDGKRCGELRCDQYPKLIVNDIVISPESATVAVLTGNFQVRLWDIRTRSCQRILELSTSGQSICFTPCGHFLLVTQRNGFTVWDFDTNLYRVAPFIHERKALRFIHFIPGTYDLLVISRSSNISIWDFSTFFRFTGSKSRSGSRIYGPSPIKAMALSSDHTALATSSASYSLLIWNLKTMTQLFDVPDTQGSIADAMAFSSDGTMLAVLVYNRVKLWRTYGDLRPTLVCITEPLPVAFNPSQVHPCWTPYWITRPEAREFLELKFPSWLPSGDMIIQMRREFIEFSFNTQTGECGSRRWEPVKQTMSFSDEWLQYTDGDGCTINIIFIPEPYRHFSFTSSGNRVVIGNADGEFSILDFDIEELEEYSQGLANRYELEMYTDDS